MPSRRVGGKTSIVIVWQPEWRPYTTDRRHQTSPFPYSIFMDCFTTGCSYRTSRHRINVVILALPAGMSLNYVGGRTSKDARVSKLAGYWRGSRGRGIHDHSVKPFAFEFKVNENSGPTGTEVQLGASVGMAPTPRWHVSFGTQVTGTTASSTRNILRHGCRSRAGDRGGDTMSAYTPGSDWHCRVDLDQRLCADGALGFGDAPRTQRPHRLSREDSPLTERTFGVDFAVGAIYKFEPVTGSMQRPALCARRSGGRRYIFSAAAMKLCNAKCANADE